MIYRLNKHVNGNFSVATFNAKRNQWLPTDHKNLTFEQVQEALEALGFVVIDDYQRGQIRQTIYTLGGE